MRKNDTMKDSESILDHFFKYDTLEIPVYQRNYDWKKENCDQLFRDLKNNCVKYGNKRNHFFGSIIYIIDQDNDVRSVIDGQQRITTIALLLAAMRDLIDSGDILPIDNKLSEKIDRRLVDQDDGKVFIRPVKKDRAPYDAIARHKPDDYDIHSNVYINYDFFKDRIKTSLDGMTADDLYESIRRLHVMVIRLNSTEDDAQMVFESINSTGLNLTEGDKIRNFMLMNLSSKDQTHLYEDYWIKIESNVDDLSKFYRNFLTAVDEKIPNLNHIYLSFKDYVDSLEDDRHSQEDVFKLLLRYSKIYGSIVNSKLEYISSKASNMMFRINYIESTVSYPFIMRILDAHGSGIITKADVEDILEVLENYLIRRLVCGRQTNALNKVFQTLYRSLEKLDIRKDPVEKLKYIILQKEGSSSYPTDSEVIDSLARMDIYNNHKMCPCVLSILEGGNKDSGNILARIDSPDYDDRLSIEHIMPQKKTDEWRAEIGDNYDEIHKTWVHRLGNLTLTAYNSEYGCKSFAEKRDLSPGGLGVSPLNLNQMMKTVDRWTLDVIEERNEHLSRQFVDIVPSLTSGFAPIDDSEKTLEEYTLDEGADFFAFVDIKGYSIFGEKHRCKNGIVAFIEAMQNLYSYNPEKIIEAEKNKKKGTLGPWLSTAVPENDRDYKMIGPGMYIYKNIDHKTKAALMIRAAEIQGIDLSDVAFIGYR